MNFLRSYVLAYLVEVMLTLKHDLHMSKHDYDAIVALTVSMIQGPIGDIIVVPLAIIFWVFNQARAIDVSLPDWLTNGVNFVLSRVIPAWDWVVGNIENFYNFTQRFDGMVWDRIHYAVDGLLNGWYDTLNYVRWLRDSFGDTLAWLASDPWGAVREILDNVLRSELPQIWEIVDFWNGVLSQYEDNLYQLISDPIGYIYRVIYDYLINNVPGLDRIFDIIQWWESEGASFLLNLSHDPAGVFLDLIAEPFIDWFMKLIADNW